MRVPHAVALALLLLIACGLRLLWIDATPVWCDELLSIHISNAHDFSVDALPRDVLLSGVPDLMTIDGARPVREVWSSMGGDMHPPLYYLQLRLWREVFGDAPAAIRSLSALFGTLAVAAAFLAGRELCGTVGGLWVAALNALAANHIYYSQEARMYAPTLLWTTLALFLVLRIGRVGFTPRRGAALALVSLAAMLTLYLSACVLIACALYTVASFRGPTRTRTLLAFAAAGVAWACLWLPFLLGQHFHALKSDWLKASPDGLLPLTLQRVATLPMRQFGGVIRDSMEPAAYAFALVLVLPALAARRAPAVALPWLAMGLILCVPAIADLARSTNMLRWDRYTVCLIPATSLALVATSFALLGGRHAGSRHAWARHAVPAAMAIFCATSLVPLYTEMSRYDFRALARYAEQASQREPGRLIFASTWNHKFNSVLFLATQYYWRTPPGEAMFVESVAAIDRLPRDVATDDVILVAGDLPAEPSATSAFAPKSMNTWQLGVGSVHAMARRPTAATRPSTAEGEPSR